MPKYLNTKVRNQKLIELSSRFGLSPEESKVYKQEGKKLWRHEHMSSRKLKRLALDIHAQYNKQVKHMR